MRARVLAPVLIAAAAAGVAAARIAPVVSPSESPAGRAPGWYATVETTMGAFTIRLLPEQAPQSVAHFVGFATGTIEYTDVFSGSPTKRPLYDGMAIHRVTTGTRIEAGDPTGTGRGAPPFWVPREEGPVTTGNGSYRVGTTGASGGRNSGSLFFVSVVPEPYLNTHNVFGEVVEGREIVDKITMVKIDEHKVPVTPVLINKVTVFRVGNVPPLPAPVRYRPPTPELPQIREQELPG